MTYYMSPFAYNIFYLYIDILTSIIIFLCVFQYQEFEWSPQTQGAVLSSFFYGYAVTQVIYYFSVRHRLFPA
jgi:hypothetical protein